MTPIIVPTINSNDTDALLLSWSLADGGTVRAGDTIAILETTKATFDLAADADGLLHIVAQPRTRCEFGTTIGWIFADAAERDQNFDPAAAEKKAAHGGMTVTRAAQELIARHGITDEQLRGLGRKIIKAGDLAPLLPQESAPTAGLNLSSQQQSIARVVSRSRATIADSFLVKKICVDAALDALGQFSREEKALAGLPDLLVWIAARLAGEFPFFFGELGGDLRFKPSASGDIGVTFDVGHGLFIPDVRNAAQLTLKEIAKQMMGFRLKATRNTFHAEEIAGAAMSISINMDADVVLVQPVIPPGQTCMLSLNAVLPEVVPGADGAFTARRYIQLGVAFDHRVINGFHANAFANAIKQRVEQPQPDAWRGGGLD
jgi:2-oxoglutarate dehydrogenase E2 component (dihydrolipoamide succinyltransferase)